MLSPGQKVNILLVDDLQANLDALRVVLDDLGQNLVEARSGKEALQRLLENDFAVVLLDVQMYDLDGFETARLLRSREKSWHTPIIFLTAHDTDRTVVEQAYALGAVEFLTKPFVPVILKAKVTVFVELFQKTAQLKLQAEELRKVERQEFEQRLEKAVRESEARKAAILETALDCIITMDQEGKVIEFNPAAEKTFGYSRDEVMGQLMADHIIPRSLRKQHSRGLAHNLANGQGPVLGQRLETTARRADGSEFPVELAITVISQHGPPVFTGHIRDITERKCAEQAILRYNQRLKILHEIDGAVIAGAPPAAIAVAALPLLRDILGVGRVVVNLFDLQSGEVEWLAAAGRRRVHVGPGVRYSIRFMGDLEALKRGELQIIDVDALPRGPEVDALLASGVHTYGVVPMIANGELIGALSFGGAPAPFSNEQIDIAQEVATQFAIALTQAQLHERVKRQAEELEVRVRERTRELEVAHAELQTTNAEMLALTTELKAANKELEAFSYSVSHDLRAPLRAIDGFSRILLEEHGERLSEEAVEYLELVRKNTQQMGLLVDDLLSFSRLSRQQVKKQTVEPAKIVRQCLEEMRGEQDGRRVEITLGDLLACQADPSLLKQVWFNLLSNAFKYTRNREVALIEVGCRDDRSGERTYFVKDNGVGFDMQYAPKLFGVFQRLHRAEDYEGTGVGLAIVQRIVLRHGGRVWAEAQPGEGATFSFTLVGDSI